MKPVTFLERFLKTQNVSLSKGLRPQLVVHRPFGRTARPRCWSLQNFWRANYGPRFDIPSADGLEGTESKFDMESSAVGLVLRHEGQDSAGLDSCGVSSSFRLTVHVFDIYPNLQAIVFSRKSFHKSFTFQQE
jgi:hypothetical protein